MHIQYYHIFDIRREFIDLTVKFKQRETIIDLEKDCIYI